MYDISNISNKTRVWRNFYFNSATALVDQDPLLSRFHDRTYTHHTRYDSSGRVTSPRQRPLPDNTQHSQKTDIHFPGGIQTRNPSKRAAADPRLRPCGHWHRLWRNQSPLSVISYRHETKTHSHISYHLIKTKSVVTKRKQAHR